MTKLMSTVKPVGQTEKLCPKRHGDTVCQWEAFDLIKDLQRYLKLTDRDLTVLQAHLSILPKSLNKNSPKWSYMNVTELAKRANGMDDSTFYRAEIRLEQRGLIRRHLSANARRFPIYHPETRKIVGAYGVDLQPLFDRLDEFGDLREKIKQEQIEKLNMVTRISSWLGNIRRTLQDRYGDVPDAFTAVAKEMRRVTRRKEVTLEDLMKIEDKLIEMEKTFLHEDEEQVVPEVQSEAPCPADHTVNAGDDHQNEWHIESETKESKYMTLENAVPKKSDALGDVWDRCEMFSSFFEEPPRTVNAFSEMLYNFSKFVNIEERMAVIALNVFGPIKTIEVMDYLALKIDGLQNPNGYLMSMIKSYENGEAVAAGRVCPDVRHP
jgi:DNA-binding MarR family transcriptional regulator